MDVQPNSASCGASIAASSSWKLPAVLCGALGERHPVARLYRARLTIVLELGVHALPLFPLFALAHPPPTTPFPFQLLGFGWRQGRYSVHTFVM